jgi:OmpA-OmpF porin, OOP family
MKNKLMLSASLVALAVSAPSYAFSRANSVILSAVGGHEWFAPKRHLENTGVGYVLAGYNFTNHWGIEGLAGAFTSYSRREENYNQQIRGKQFAVDGVYHFTPYYMIEPFVLAGVGVNHYNNNNNNNDPNSEGNINAGAGAHIFANNIVALRLEARDFYTITGGKNDFMLAGGVSFFIC